LGWLGPDGELSDMAKQMFKTPEQGASTTIWAATSAQLDGEGGVYCENCNIAKLGGEGSPRWADVQPYAVDRDQAARLWRETQAMIGG
ncbi:MAG TPA: hypothetical protein PKM48_11825, partial [Parvularculaceae bacterium]|nr:hypothetical protein [Parvularculaceae bacterium]